MEIKQEIEQIIQAPSNIAAVQSMISAHSFGAVVLQLQCTSGVHIRILDIRVTCVVHRAHNA